MTDLNSSTPSVLRRWVTRGAVVAAGLGIVAGAVAPAASAEPGSFIVRGGQTYCHIDRDVRVGPVFGGRTQGNCGMAPGDFASGSGTSDVYLIGQFILPGSFNYSAWVDKIW
ncbi:hypothetical protein [uncultured Corynebacterium sp.]|uniref:hypothetical protein n=1 Tax=uncultured Corynebacterium sp. TaxID=159447 RepID=UPI0025D7A717|nr:hypothetical protein [uncultured Corynebacterium sp.]